LSILRIPTARVFLPLLQPARFKGARGGRGGGKSHFYAEQLVEEALTDHIRAACLREVQNSIKESVKQLLEDKINALGVRDLFRITENEITGPNDSLFIFKGLRNHTVASIKSLEGFNRAWVEEAQTISNRSLDILTPTLRAKGAELRFGWNPGKATDPIEKLFRDNEGDPDFICVTVNWMDNPWFPEGLRADMRRDLRNDPGKAAHIWGGQYESNTQASIFRNWRVEAFEPPADAIHRFGADWGFAVDPSVLIRCHNDGRTLYVDREAWEVGCEIDKTPALFDQIEGSRNWLIRADSARPETVSYMQRQGFKIIPALKGPGSIEDGIEFLRSFDIVVHPRCVHVIEELSSYSYKTDPHTGDILPLLDDKYNHTIDALRYALEELRRSGWRPPTTTAQPRKPDDYGDADEDEDSWKTA
jgi:phage terminase large subunit